MNRELLQQARDALEDNRSGMAYIRQSHGDLYGVGWERAEQKAQKALAALDAELAKPAPKDREEEIQKVLGLAYQYATAYSMPHLDVAAPAAAAEWLRLEAAVRALGAPKF